MTQVADPPAVEALPETDTLPPGIELTPEAPKPMTGIPPKPVGITPKTWQSLPPKGKRFVAAYVKDGNAAKAYQAGGYIADGAEQGTAKTRRNAYNVTRGRKVRTALCEHEQERDALERQKGQWERDRVTRELERLEELSIEKKDYATAARCIELIGKMGGMFSDVMRFDVGAQREYTEAEQIEAGRIARLLLTEGSDADEPPAEDVDGKVGRSRESSGRYAPEGTPALPAPEPVESGPEPEPPLPEPVSTGAAVVHRPDLGSVAVPGADTDPPQPPKGGGVDVESTPSLA